MPELQDQVMQWKRRALKVVVADAKLAKYDTLFKEHTLLKFEVVAWWQKIGKREARWNELKGELNAILDVAPLRTLANEVAYRQQLMAYRSLPWVQN